MGCSCSRSSKRSEAAQASTTVWSCTAVTAIPGLRSSGCSRSRVFSRRSSKRNCARRRARRYRDWSFVRRNRFGSSRLKHEDVTVNALALAPFDGNAREVSVTLHRRGARREMPRRFCARHRDFPARIRCICKERGIEIAPIIPSNRRPGVLTRHCGTDVGRMRKEPAGALQRGVRRGRATGGVSMASVAIRDVRKAFGAIEVIHGVDVLIDDGEFVVLVGPSGCGKSTLLRMIAGLENITSGEIRIGERVVNRVPPKERDIAMVFQNYALYPHMTVAANMGFSLMLRGAPKTEIEQRVGGAADILGLGPLLGRYPRQLSGGQRQRVAMGRAIVRDPQVFLFDEP